MIIKHLFKSLCHAQSHTDACFIKQSRSIKLNLVYIHFQTYAQVGLPNLVQADNKYLIQPCSFYQLAPIAVSYLHPILADINTSLSSFWHQDILMSLNFFYFGKYMQWKTLDKVSEQTGLSSESLRALKKRGIFREKIHWVKAPNGRIFLNLTAVENWITGGVSAKNIGNK